MEQKLKYFLSFSYDDNKPIIPGLGDDIGWCTQFKEAFCNIFNNYTRLKYQKDFEYYYSLEDTGNSEIPETIRKELQSSQYLIALVSNNYLKSDWCKQEIDYFVRELKRPPKTCFIVRQMDINCAELASGRLSDVKTRELFTRDVGTGRIKRCDPKEHRSLYENTLVDLARGMHDLWCEKLPPARVEKGGIIFSVGRKTKKRLLVDGAHRDQPFVERVVRQLQEKGAGDVGLVSKSSKESRFELAGPEWRARVGGSDVIVLVRAEAPQGYVVKRAIDASQEFARQEEVSGAAPGSLGKSVIVLDAGKDELLLAEDTETFDTRVEYVSIPRPNPSQCAQEVMKRVIAR